jgi:hypothetical protein
VAETSGRVLRRWITAVRWEKVERAVRPMQVGVVAQDAEDVLEMPSAEDQDPVEAVGADRANPAFRKAFALVA